MWLQRGSFPEHMNDTNIVLIPKVDKPTSMKDLRPISLCNVVYKIISKVLANRLKPLLNRADIREANCMKKILNDYEKASGQAVNYTKSEVYFSRNTPNNIKEQISDILGVQEVMGTGRYLGMPSMIGRNKKAVFGYLKDRMWKKVQSWSGKHLSKAGREVLVKSVAQAIPTYCMSTVLLPESLGEELERMINSFWWGSNKSSGRGKQDWQLLTNQDTILSRVLKAKYYPKTGFLEANLGHNPSYVWRSIHASQVVVIRGLRWRLGNGNSINVWKHPWLRNDNYTHVTTTMMVGREDMRVAELVNYDTGTCNIDTACYSDVNIYCVAACVRDAQGQFVKAYTRRFEGKPEIAEAEASGVLEALQWLRQQQLSNVQIETDCLQVCRSVRVVSCRGVRVRVRAS
ncbi:putative mitochondrial protein [Trifolium repens]|nr:putative mitochondrial protein [Trifolium repens]